MRTLAPPPTLVRSAVTMWAVLGGLRPGVTLTVNVVEPSPSLGTALGDADGEQDGLTGRIEASYVKQSVLQRESTSPSEPSSNDSNASMLTIVLATRSGDRSNT